MVSLDGFVEGPNGELSWSEPGPELHKHFNDQYLTGEIDTSLYGRRLYEIMASYWPTVNEDSDVPEVEKEFARTGGRVLAVHPPCDPWSRKTGVSCRNGFETDASGHPHLPLQGGAPEI